MKLKFVTLETVVFEYIIYNDNTINLYISDLIDPDFRVFYNDPKFLKTIFSSKDEFNIIKRLAETKDKTTALLNIKNDNVHIKLIANAILKDMIVYE